MPGHLFVKGRGFNEAEAFTPRIHRRSGRRIYRLSRFNEAEAFTPRILSTWRYVALWI